MYFQGWFTELIVSPIFEASVPVSHLCCQLAATANMIDGNMSLSRDMWSNTNRRLLRKSISPLVPMDTNMSWDPTELPCCGVDTAIREQRKPGDKEYIKIIQHRKNSTRVAKNYKRKHRWDQGGEKSVLKTELMIHVMGNLSYYL